MRRRDHQKYVASRIIKDIITWILCFISSLLDFCIERKPGKVCTELTPEDPRDWRVVRVKGHVIMLERTKFKGL